MGFYVGDAVLFVGSWNSFKGQRGKVTQVAPLMVRVEGDTYPMCFDSREVVPLEEHEVNLTGAE